MKEVARVLGRDLRQALDALAHAGHGEMLPRSAKYRILNLKRSEPRSAPTTATEAWPRQE